MFSCREAALRFASNPEQVIAKVEEKARSSPELNRLLRLNLQFSHISSSSGVGVLWGGRPAALRPVPLLRGGSDSGLGHVRVTAKG